MKQLSFFLLLGLMLVCPAFLPILEHALFPGLSRSFKKLRKNFGEISDDRREILLGIQHRINRARFQKTTPIIEFLSSDGSFAAPIAQAVLQAALASYGITDINFFSIPSAPNKRALEALTSLGFKVSDQNMLTARFSDLAAPVRFISRTSSPGNGHILLLEGTEVVLSSPDRFTIQIDYKNMLDCSDADYQVQARLIATEMLWVAKKVKQQSRL